MKHYSSCQVCNSTRLHTIFSVRDYLVSGKEYELIKCSDCSFIFTQDHPDSNEIGAWYLSDEYISHSNSRKGIFNYLYHVAREIMLRKKARLIRSVCGIKKGSILDIGSGTGYFPNRMKQAGWEATGIEINDAAREFSVKNFGLNILKPDSIKELPDNSFDCITLWHVLEHLEEPGKYMNEITRLLKPEGTCIIALPNPASSDAKHYRHLWAAYDVPRHLWHFSPDSFKLFSHNNGFRLTGMKRLPLDAFYVSILSEKNHGIKFSFLKGIITGMFSALSSFSDIKRTSSLIYILKKK